MTRRVENDFISSSVKDLLLEIGRAPAIPEEHLKKVLIDGNTPQEFIGPIMNKFYEDLPFYLAKKDHVYPPNIQRLIDALSTHIEK